MEEELYKAILNQTYTARNLQKRIRVLKMYLLSKLFTQSAQPSPSVENEIVEEKEWLESINFKLISQITTQNVYQIFEKLEQRIQLQKVLTIYVGFDLPKDEISRLGVNLRSTYGPDFIFEIKFDPNVIGGVAFVWNGVYKDFSVRSMIEAKKDEILSGFRMFVGRNT